MAEAKINRENDKKAIDALKEEAEKQRIALTSLRGSLTREQVKTQDLTVERAALLLALDGLRADRRNDLETAQLRESICIFEHERDLRRFLFGFHFEAEKELSKLLAKYRLLNEENEKVKSDYRRDQLLWEQRERQMRTHSALLSDAKVAADAATAEAVAALAHVRHQLDAVTAQHGALQDAHKTLAKAHLLETTMNGGTSVALAARHADANSLVDFEGRGSSNFGTLIGNNSRIAAAASNAMITGASPIRTSSAARYPSVGRAPAADGTPAAIAVAADGSFHLLDATNMNMGGTVGAADESAGITSDGGGGAPLLVTVNNNKGNRLAADKTSLHNGRQWYPSGAPNTHYHDPKPPVTVLRECACCPKGVHVLTTPRDNVPIYADIAKGTAVAAVAAANPNVSSPMMGSGSGVSPLRQGASSTTQPPTSVTLAPTSSSQSRYYNNTTSDQSLQQPPQHTLVIAASPREVMPVRPQQRHRLRSASNGSRSTANLLIAPTSGYIRAADVSSSSGAGGASSSSSPSYNIVLKSPTTAALTQHVAADIGLVSAAVVGGGGGGSSSTMMDIIPSRAIHTRLHRDSLQHVDSTIDNGRPSRRAASSNSTLHQSFAAGNHGGANHESEEEAMPMWRQQQPAARRRTSTTSAATAANASAALLKDQISQMWVNSHGGASRLETGASRTAGAIDGRRKSSNTPATAGSLLGINSSSRAASPSFALPLTADRFVTARNSPSRVSQQSVLQNTLIRQQSQIEALKRTNEKARRREEERASAAEEQRELISAAVAAAVEGIVGGGVVRNGSPFSGGGGGHNSSYHHRSGSATNANLNSSVTAAALPEALGTNHPSSHAIRTDTPPRGGGGGGGSSGQRGGITNTQVIGATPPPPASLLSASVLRRAAATGTSSPHRSASNISVSRTNSPASTSAATGASRGGGLHGSRHASPMRNGNNYRSGSGGSNSNLLEKVVPPFRPISRGHHAPSSQVRNSVAKSSGATEGSFFVDGGGDAVAMVSDGDDEENSDVHPAVDSLMKPSSAANNTTKISSGGGSSVTKRDPYYSIAQSQQAVRRNEIRLMEAAAATNSLVSKNQQQLQQQKGNNINGGGGGAPHQYAVGLSHGGSTPRPRHEESFRPEFRGGGGGDEEWVSPNRRHSPQARRRDTSDEPDNAGLHMNSPSVAYGSGGSGRGEHPSPSYSQHSQQLGGHGGGTPTRHYESTKEARKMQAQMEELLRNLSAADE